MLSVFAWLESLIWIGGSFVLALGVYAIARALFAKKGDDSTGTLASSLVLRVGGLHGLILALVFATELANLNRLQAAIDHEAGSLREAFFDLELVGDDVAVPLQVGLVEYLAVIVDDE